MYFMIIAHDYPGALERRMAVREEHLQKLKAMKANGTLHFAAVLLDEAGAMCGSTLMVDMPDQAAVEAFVAAEAYKTNKVWERIEIRACKLPPI